MEQSLTRQTTKAPTPPTKAEADRLATYRNALERTAAGLWSISDQRAPGGADRQALERRLAILQAGDGRAQASAIIARVGRLFLRFPSSRLTDGTAEATIAAYATDLEPFPLWAIDQAMLEAIQKGGAFAPSSPELRKACERVMVASRLEAADIRAVLNAEVYHEPSADERERTRAAFDELIAELKLREPFASPQSRPASHWTKPEAESALERLKANPPILPKLSNATRRAMGLPPISSEAAA